MARLGQRFDEVLPVNVVQEYSLAPVAAAHDVIHGASILDAQLAGHGRLVMASGASGNQKNDPNYDPFEGPHPGRAGSPLNPHEGHRQPEGRS
jgi:hypothetical protein